MSAILTALGALLTLLKNPAFLKRVVAFLNALESIRLAAGKEAAAAASDAAVEQMKRARNDAEIMEALLTTRDLSNGKR